MSVPQQTKSGPRSNRMLSNMWGRIITLLLIANLSGIVGAFIWQLIVQLPSYVITEQGTAVITNQGLTRFFTADGWYVLLGLIIGLILGVVTWFLARGLGWPVAILGLGAGVIAGMVCLAVGEAFGPSNFAQRIAEAGAGQRVQIDFILRSPIAILVWPFATLVPILLYSSLGPDRLDEWDDIPIWPISLAKVESVSQDQESK